MNRPIRTLRGWSIRTAAFAHAIGGEGTLVARFGAPAIALAVLAAAVFELHAMDWPMVLAMVPTRPLFWLVFAVAYLVPPACDWLIYRRIWAMPARGLLATVRKMVGNELLFGYVGEAYLYAWARREGRVSAQAFGAVKDVSILSAAVGNGATALVAIAAIPVVRALHLHLPVWAVLVSGVIVLAPPAAALFLRKALFGLAPALLAEITVIHAVRATATIGLTALLWHLALPQIAVGWWLVFSAMKLLIYRLPLISNKELVFAGITAALLGRTTDVAALMTMMASIQVATHVLAGLGLAAGDLGGEIARRVRRARAPHRPFTPAL
ncbi:hypothetical protein [Sphingomonas sp. CROZ-RG-20F-R02-07]|uniref:hypothetical protein n=1 Tax=Sphingomonas sp. CROZ-RG-20F-R02-07 TaxID=2914832 RepID=UPI001F58E6DE|nr:hypothetical protein [Sphingomonas sp. CROZ-RG-20F-R02-07]